MQQNLTITYKSPREIKIGDVFYKLKRTDFQHFREPCRVCGDKRDLTINGVTFKCPCCGSAEEIIKICGYIVQRYRVYKIADEVRNDEWKPSHQHRIQFGIYRKMGHGYMCASHSESSFGEYDLEHFFNVSEADKISPYNAEQYLFDDYALAVKMAQILTDAQVQKLEEYNAVHGSNYKAVFTEEHDRKSS